MCRPDCSTTVLAFTFTPLPLSKKASPISLRFSFQNKIDFWGNLGWDVCSAGEHKHRGRRYLSQLVPDLVEVAEDRGMDLGAADVVHVAQDTQNPPPQHEGRVGVPTGEAAAGDDAEIIRQALAAVCMAPPGHRKHPKRYRKLGLTDY